MMLIKMLCRKAYKDGYFQKNPAENIMLFRKTGLQMEIHDFNEIKLPAESECDMENVKRAFLFCLNSGLRFDDVNALSWENVQNDRIIIKSLEITKESIAIDLNVN